MTDPLEKIIRPIVEGQIRGFLKEHPQILTAVDWYKPRRDDKATTFVNSLAKRIVRDLLCPSTRARLAAVIGGTPTAAPPYSPVEPGLEASAGDLEYPAGSPAASEAA